MANKYEVGDLVRITGTFTNAAGANVDPTIVRGKYKDPSGNAATESSPTNSAVGVYYFDIDADEAGVWYYRWWSTGAGQAAAEQSFTVQAAQAV